MASDESDTVLVLGGVANSNTRANGDVADDVPQDDVNVGPFMLGLGVSVAIPKISCNGEKRNNYPTDNDNLAEIEDVKDDLFDASNATGMDQELGLAAVAVGERDREGVQHGSPSALECSQCVSGVIGKGDSVDGPTSSAGNEGEVQEFIHGEPICDASRNQLLTINNRTATKIMALVSQRRILARQMVRSGESTNALKTMALVSQKRILAKQMARAGESTNAMETMALVSQTRILANQMARSDESTIKLQPTKNQQSPKMAPPGPGWTFAFRQDELTQRRCHWISPTLKLEFTRWPPACIFEELRKEFGFDEVVALEKYRERNKGTNPRIIGQRSDERSISSSPNAKKRRSGQQFHRGLVKHSTKSEASDSPDSLLMCNANGGRQQDKKQFGGDGKQLGGCKRKRSAPSEAMSIRRSKEENTTKFNVSSANVSKSRSNDKDDRSLVDLKKARLSLKGATTHDDVDSCYMCNDGGAFHVECHIPRLLQIPKGQWRCCECSAMLYEKRQRCGECEDCLKPECGACAGCKGKKKFGGDGKHVKPCKDRQCKNMRFAAPERISCTGNTPTCVKANNVTLKSIKSSAFKPKAMSSSIVVCPFRTSPEPTPNNGFNSCEVKIIRLKSSNKTRSFFGEMFQGKTLRVVSNLNDENPERTVIHNGMKHTLASSKLVNGSGGYMPFNRQKDIELLYVRSKCLQTKLEKICSFASLKSKKVVARLGHLQTEARSILYIDPVNIEKIREEGHEGCGFCPDFLFEEWGLNNTDSIQVRIVGPKLGLAKGMLLKRQGISCIQIPESMIKAPSSETCDANYAAVIIKNEFPSDENIQIGRFLDPDAKDPRESWKRKVKKPLSEMYRRMLVGYGVKHADVDAYTRSAKDHVKLKHAHLKGVIDPTGALPQNKVFISGYAMDINDKRVLFGSAHPKIFLSRSPCLEPTDAKLVSVVGQKPRDMSVADWSMLCSYGFGTIIFPRARAQSVPLTSIIAGGDLDGDDYFVLWDEHIIHHLVSSKDKLTVKSRKLLNTLELPSGVQHSVKKGMDVSRSADEKWLRKAQDLMLDFSTQLRATQLVGKLWSLCIKASTRSDGSIDLYNVDAIAYARAYKDAMDIQKHGGRIFLPQHLHGELKDYQLLLTSS